MFYTYIQKMLTIPSSILPLLQNCGKKTDFMLHTWQNCLLKISYQMLLM